MSKITPAHLPPFAKLVEGALRDGTVSVEQAKDFSDTVFQAALDQQVREGRASRLTPEGKGAKPDGSA